MTPQTSATTIDLTMTVEMTTDQRAQWATDNNVPPADVPADIASYVLHNLLDPSQARHDYWHSVNLHLTPRPADATLTWQHHATEPGCDELAIETTWGTWPYRILGYHDEAIVERFTPSYDGRRRTIPRGTTTFDAMMAHARAAAQEWDREAQ